MAVERGVYVHDLRHRCSLELRPDPQLDAGLRALAKQLEDAGLVPEGEHRKPRFHPHLTIGRAVAVPTSVAAATAEAVAAHATISFTATATFGHGRIIYLTLASDEIARIARRVMVAGIAPDALDPTMHSRAWEPHVTIAYAVPEPRRAQALELVRAALPLRGTFATVETWHLDERPTRLIDRIAIQLPRA